MGFVSLHPEHWSAWEVSENPYVIHFLCCNVCSVSGVLLSSVLYCNITNTTPEKVQALWSNMYPTLAVDGDWLLKTWSRNKIFHRRLWRMSCVVRVVWLANFRKLQWCDNSRILIATNESLHLIWVYSYFCHFKYCSSSIVNNSSCHPVNPIPPGIVLIWYWDGVGF